MKKNYLNCLKSSLLFLYAMLVVFGTNAQTKSISGVVLDTQGQAMPGVNVVVKGTTIGTVTSIEGEFELTVDSKSTVLVFSFIGMKSQELDITGKNTLKVIMETDAIGLDEVVAVGYGTVRKSDLTGAVSSVEVESLEERPIVSADQLLVGSAAGVSLTSNSGAPGAGSSINIRGVSTINGSAQPLVVIDGFPMENENSFVTDIDGSSNQPELNPLAMINPNDIESIEVLKDASSTAIYGSRGANGVIIITTKKGKRGGKVTYNFRSDFAQLPNERKVDMLGTRDYLEYKNAASIEAGGEPRYTENEIQEILNEYGNIDWQDDVYQTGISMDHQLSFIGGDDKTIYAIIGGYSDIEGIIINSSLDRYSLRTNLSRQMNRWFRVNSNFSYNRTLSNQVNHSSQFGVPSASVVMAAMMQPPVIAESEDAEDGTFQDNPVTLAEEVKNDYDIQNLTGQIGLDFEIVEGLTYKSTLNFNNYKSIRQKYYPRGTYVGDATNGSASYGQAENYTYVLENILSYNNEIKNGHRINAVAGFTYRHGMQKRLSNTSTGFINDNLGYNYLQGAEVNGKVFLSKVETELASFLGRLNYSIKDKYSLTFTGRYDGTSRLAEKWSFFPSGAAAWRINQENFMKDFAEVSNLKLRASYGLSGRQAVPPLSGVSTLASATGIAGEEFTTVIFGTSNLGSGNMGNPNLKWETTAQLNIGLDLGLMDNRFRLTMDWFKKNTTDLLLNLPLPYSAAFNSYWTNLGEIENQGFELEVGADIVQKEFKWDLSGTFSVVKNEVLDLGEIDAVYGDKWINAGGVTLNQPLHIARVGHEVGAFYGYKFEGIFQNQAEIDASAQPDAKPGDWIFKDIAGALDENGNPLPDGKITPEDQTVIGSATPDFVFGLTNNFAYKNFTLSVFVQGSVGNEVMNLNRYITDALAGGINRNVRQEAYDNSWNGEGSTNTFGRIRGDGVLYGTRASDFLIEDASYVRLKNVTLAYDIPLKNTKIINGAKLYVTGTNLFVITDYSGYDPEVSAKNSALEPGVDFGVFPQPRVISFGANIEF